MNPKGYPMLGDPVEREYSDESQSEDEEMDSNQNEDSESLEKSEFDW